MNPLNITSQTSILPLSRLQQQIFFSTKLVPQSIRYHAIKFFHLPNKPLPKILVQANAILMEKYEILRTYIIQNENNYYQKIALRGENNLTITTARNTTEAVDKAMEIATSPFNLASLPLYRIILINIQGNGSLLGVVFHHIITDGYSMLAYLQQLMEIYNYLKEKFIYNQRINVIQFQRYVRYELEEIELLRIASAKYWNQALMSLHPFSFLEFFNIHHNVFNCKAMRFVYSFPKINHVAVPDLHNISNFNLLLALFLIVLSAVTGRKDIVIGAAISQRESFLSRQKNTDACILGPLTNVIPAWISTSNDASILEIVLQVKESFYYSLKHYGKVTFSGCSSLTKYSKKQPGIETFEVVVAYDAFDTIDTKLCNSEAILTPWREPPFPLSTMIKISKNDFYIISDYNALIYPESWVQKISRLVAITYNCFLDNTKLTYTQLQHEITKVLHGY